MENPLKKLFKKKEGPSFSEQLSRVKGILIVSFALTIASLQAEAQSMTQADIGFPIPEAAPKPQGQPPENVVKFKVKKTGEIKNPNGYEDKKAYKITKKEYLRQRDLLIEYYSSAMYRRRLIKELTRNLDFKLERETKTEGSETSDVSDFDPAEVFPEIDFNNINPAIMALVDRMIESRLNSLKYTPFMITNKGELGDGRLGEYHTPMSDARVNGIPAADKVFVQSNLPENEQNTSGHEQVHSSVQAELALVEFTGTLMSLMAHSNSDYLNKEAESFARLGSFKLSLMSNGLHNPSAEDITEDQFDEFIKNSEVIKSSDVQELLKIFTKKQIIWLYNNVAGGIDTHIRFDGSGPSIEGIGIGDAYIPVSLYV